VPRVAFRDENLRDLWSHIHDRSGPKIAPTDSVLMDRTVAKDDQNVMHSVGLPSLWKSERYCMIARQSSAGHVTTF